MSVQMNSVPVFHTVEVSLRRISSGPYMGLTEVLVFPFANFGGKHVSRSFSSPRLFLTGALCRCRAFRAFMHSSFVQISVALQIAVQTEFYGGRKSPPPPQLYDCCFDENLGDKSSCYHFFWRRNSAAKCYMRKCSAT